MTAYKRFLIPLKNGRLLAERLQDKTIRLTLLVRQAAKKPLDLWLFDKDKAYRYPKTLYSDKTGSIVLRQALHDTGLDEIHCACLTDSTLQPEAVGYCGEKIDWQSILLCAGKPKEPKKEEPPKTEISAEGFKEQVREMVEQFNDQLKPPHCSSCPKANGIPDDLNWQKTDLYGLAQNKRLWRYARNPFVSEECKKHDHLLLAENDKFCFLGVPCTPEERYLGRSQGFRIFTDCNGTSYCILKCEK